MKLCINKQIIMANWAYTQYVIEGPKETLTKIKKAIKKPSVIENESAKNWEGNVLLSLGIEWDRKGSDGPGTGRYMRGFIVEGYLELWEPTPLIDTYTLHFDAQEAWGVTEFSDVLKENFSDIKIYFYSEEKDFPLFVTNDEEGKYFDTRFYVELHYHKSNKDFESADFTTEEEMLSWISECTDGEITTMEQIDALNAKWEGDWDSDFIQIDPVQVCKNEEIINNGKYE